MPNLSQNLLLVAAGLCAVLAAALCVLYFNLYWPYREKFNEAGQYFDETTLVVYHQQTGVIAIPALALAVLAILFVLIWNVRARR